MIDIFPLWADAIGPGLISLLFVGIITHAMISGIIDHFI